MAIALSTSRINVKDLPAGTYVCVLTNQGRYAQFRVDATRGPETRRARNKRDSL